MKIGEQKRKWYDEQMRYLIKDKRMSKTEIASALQILPQTLNNIESGVRGLSDKFIDQFAETFDLSPIELFQVAKPQDEVSLVQIISSQQKTIERLTATIERLAEGKGAGEGIAHTA